MSRRMVVNRLEKEELTYELTVRGIAPGKVEDMRSRLAMAIQMEKSGDSLKYPKYPFKFDEDLQAITGKREEIILLLSEFKDKEGSGPYLKIQTKLAHMIGRIDNMEASTEEQQKIRSEILALALSLMDKLDQKAKTYSKDGSTPVDISVLENKSRREVVREHSFEEDVVNASGSTSINEPATSGAIKPILPNKWDIKFSGDKRSMSVTAFFERVEELRVARNVSKAVLLNSGIDLFTGRAYQFYQECRHEASSWDELVNMFKEEYLPPDYSEKLLEEIKRRTQFPDESIGSYLAVMSKYFQRLECPISEQVKLKILLRNILPYYQTHLGLVDVTSISQLRQLCRKLESGRQYVENFSAPSKRGNALEPDLAYVAVDTSVDNVQCSSSSVNANKSSEFLCYRCNKPGHKAIGCLMPKKKYCFKCKREGYTVRTCPSCSNSGNGHQRS